MFPFVKDFPSMATSPGVLAILINPPPLFFLWHKQPAGQKNDQLIHVLFSLLVNLDIKLLVDDFELALLGVGLRI